MREIVWVGSSREDLRAFPGDARRVVGYALQLAQAGEKHPDTKPLQGFGGAGVLEVVADDDGGTFRAVYTVRFPGGIYVLHAFQKKSTHGIRTPQRELDAIRRRLKRAEEIYAARVREGERPHT